MKSEVLKEIQNLKLKKAPGYDLISPKVLKELPLEVYISCHPAPFLLPNPMQNSASTLDPKTWKTR